MGVSALGFRNLADFATLTTSNAEFSNMTIQELKGEQVSEHWRSTEASDAIIIDFLSEVDLDVIALFGVPSNVTTHRIRLSNTDPSGVAGEEYDSGLLAIGVDPRYSSIVQPLPETITARYGRIDLDTSNNAEAGRLFAGPLLRFEYDFSGWKPGYLDPSDIGYTWGQNAVIDRTTKRRYFQVNYGLLEAEDADELLEFERICGASKDCLFIKDVASVEMSKNSLWGLPVFLDGVDYPYEGRDDLGSKALRIEERV